MSTVRRLSPIEEMADFLARRPTNEEIPAFHLSDEALGRARFWRRARMRRLPLKRAANWIG